MRLIAGCLLTLAFVAGSLAPAVDLADEQIPAAATAVNKGLARMAALQGGDGSWQGYKNEVGLTASGALAFMAHGHVPGSGPYGAVTAKALQFIVRNAQSDGLLSVRDSASPMYEHGLATLALAEGWGETSDKRLRDALRRAVDLICSIQNSRGGWRYQPNSNPNNGDDISVTVMQLMALRAAKDAGMNVPKEVIDAGIAYVKSCHSSKASGKDGGFRYMAAAWSEGSGWARTGAGITALQVAGNYKATEVSEGIEYLMTYQPVGSLPFPEKKDDQFYYGVYYTTMGMYQAQSLGSGGKKAWDRFYPGMVKTVVGMQNPDGSWGQSPNNIPYCSAMSLLVLGVPCRYLPIYQR